MASELAQGTVPWELSVIAHDLEQVTSSGEYQMGWGRKVFFLYLLKLF